MSSFVNLMPFEMYIFVLLFALGLCIYGIYEMRTKQPEHPMVWMLPFGIFADIALVVYRCSVELTENLKFQQIADIIATISAVLFLISFIVTFIIAHKKHYTNAEKFKKVKPVLIFCGVGILICIILFIVADKFL